MRYIPVRRAVIYRDRLTGMTDDRNPWSLKRVALMTFLNDPRYVRTPVQQRRWLKIIDAFEAIPDEPKRFDGDYFHVLPLEDEDWKNVCDVINNPSEPSMAGPGAPTLMPALATQCLPLVDCVLNAGETPLPPPATAADVTA